jgi:glycosyltransferase involved in cell wall biosynthesis
LIVDDGSVDGTAALVSAWIKEQKIAFVIFIKIIKACIGTIQPYKNITAELNTCIDSDDFMPNNAVELILAKWRNY